jgi:hypothetical protein|tara:strand:- start:67011 stop:67454 length:444 start_codon:yes stop_codon:yes gene_type:complete
MSKNYRKLYENTHGEIKEEWDIHHIDWNHSNNLIINLIAIPKKIHQLVHGYLGYTTREELEVLIKEFSLKRDFKRKSISYLNHKLSKFVDLNKTSEIAMSCRLRLDNQIERYHDYLKKYEKPSKFKEYCDEVKKEKKKMNRLGAIQN